MKPIAQQTLIKLHSKVKDWQLNMKDRQLLLNALNELSMHRTRVQMEELHWGTPVVTEIPVGIDAKPLDKSA